MRARAVLTPDEQTFEFFGDYPPNLQIIHVECARCRFYVNDASDLPAEVRGLIETALETANIMEPLG